MINNIPKSENGPKNTYKTKKGIYIFSWNLSKNKFTLWQETKNGYEKLTSFFLRLLIFVLTFCCLCGIITLQKKQRGIKNEQLLC